MGTGSKPGIPPAPSATAAEQECVRPSPLPCTSGNAQWHVWEEPAPAWPVHLHTRLHHGWALRRVFTVWNMSTGRRSASGSRTHAQCDEHPGAAHTSTATRESTGQGSLPQAPRPAQPSAGSAPPAVHRDGPSCPNCSFLVCAPAR